MWRWGRLDPPDAKKCAAFGGRLVILETMAIAHSGGVFRDPSQALAAELAALRRQRHAELAALPPALGPLFAWRVARAAGGAVAVVGMAGVFAASLLHIALAGGLRVGFDVLSWLASAAFAVWGTALAVAWLGRIGLRRALVHNLRRELEPSGDSFRDLDRLRRLSVPQMAAGMLGRWEGPSLAWPLAGAAMALPLFLHFAVFEVASGFDAPPLSFGAWILLSALLVSHCHVVLARMCYRYGQQLARPRAVGRDDTGLGAVGLVMAVSLVPGLVLFGIPTILVGLTGAVLVPAMHWDARRTRERERALLAGLDGDAISG